MTEQEILTIWNASLEAGWAERPVVFARAILDAAPSGYINHVAQVLACEIECGIFEQHVAPALEVARKAISPTQGADARPAASEIGWTGNTEIDAALIMLDRLDVQSDDDTRVDAISATLRRLATRDAAPSNPWTSAPEALPTKPGNYLAMMADGNSFGYTSDEPVLVEFDAYTDRPGQFTISDSWTNGPETATEEVEFWMPLPARPTKGKTRD
ncbi:hypothetical protein ABH944_004814 [Caballeronia udeis]|uniref:DUF551 domain-containing protein n=1 Tax=Caballeronia udeis TaxID=1232866 RepID=A0ABW8MLX6_9BURK